MQSGSVDTGILDGARAFGDSIGSEVPALTVKFTQMAQLPGLALDLWQDYKADRTTSTGRNLRSNNLGGCTVFQGSFPTQIGGAIGQQYVIGSVAATAAANANWVGCSFSSGSLPTNGTRRYRQTLIFNMAADPTLAAVPYLAVTRAEFVQNATTFQSNLTPNFSGT